MKKTLDSYRKTIDKLDLKITKLLLSRFETSRQIGVLKKNEGKSITDEKREAAVLAAVKAHSGAYPDAIQNVYQTILQNSKSIQEDKA